MSNKWVDRLAAAWHALWERYPSLRWLRTWGVSGVSICSGLTTLLLFRRGIEYFPLVIGYLLLLWLVGVLLAEHRKRLARQAPRAVSTAIDYTVQTLLHGLLLFLLPIYYASTTLISGNVWFLLVLVAAGVLTTIDPWYRTATERFRWVESVLVGLGLFSSLNVAFPLVGVASGTALLLSGSVSVLALSPVFRRGRDAAWATAVLRAGCGAVAIAIGLWLVREWMPPVPLHVTHATFARAVDQLEPVEPAVRISREALRAWGRVFAYTAVAAPAGLREPVYHTWQKNGRTVTIMPSTTLQGGRPGGFRVYSWKAELGADPAGLWQVEVRAAGGQLIGRAQLLVTDP
jgi:hypothetical protein